MHPFYSQLFSLYISINYINRWFKI